MLPSSSTSFVPRSQSACECSEITSFQKKKKWGEAQDQPFCRSSQIKEERLEFVHRSTVNTLARPHHPSLFPPTSVIDVERHVRLIATIEEDRITSTPPHGIVIKHSLLERTSRGGSTVAKVVDGLRVK